MVSLDISAMFPNIPMAEALEVLEKRLGRFEKSGELAERTDLSAEEVMRLVKEVCAAPYFQCEFGLFKQVDGVPMGGPLSCLISDIFMEDYEEKVVIKLSDGTVIRADWLRFRDDTWMIWEHSQELFDEFLKKLNGIHPKIKWEAVFEDNGQLPFLDVLVVRNEDSSFTTTVYRKPTHSDRYLHWTSNHPVKDKLSGIRTLAYRANHYCSTASLKMAELTHLRKTFADNGYPEEFVEVALRKGPMTAEEEAASGDRTLGDGEEVEECGTLVVPFIKELQPALRALCTRLNLKLLYKRTVNLGNLLAPRRPSTGGMQQKNVVYKISCKQCEVSYVGQTKRTLATRVKEHSRSVDAAKTSLFVDRKEKNDTGLPAHCLDTDFSHRFDFDNAEVLCRETHWGKRLKKEAMYIAMVENTCNIQKGRDLNPIWLPLLR
ncbi:unnamed protein product, partial [Heterosigma akashiwo]